ncbi:MAG TPA: DUF1569 domain-containing protein [Bacteroidota bacterium]|nr:DUF1569 domain-containing protein [Bacteroidota bacterium]
MKSLFDKSDCQEMKGRIQNLQDSSRAQWGTMSVTQMMAHCQQPLRIALGLTTSKRSVAGVLFGKFARKKMMIPEESFRKNLPTDKSFVVANTLTFGEERETLLKLVEQFSGRGASGIPTNIHPFFGRLNPHEWDVLTWKHLDHHLRQFGA